MSYSRRQLYAMGEPLGDCATHRKADGGLILGGGGGGGGGGSQSPTQTTTNVQDLPDWAKPYAQNVLSEGAALTDTSQNPYQTYGGQRIADFSQLQTQAQQGAGQLSTGANFNIGTGLNTAAGMGSLENAQAAGGYGAMGARAGMSYGQNATDPNAVGAYMNPYLQNTLAPALQLQNQKFGQQDVANQAQATQQGAYGGGRQAIMQGLNQQNQMLAQNQLVGNAYNQAYNTANQNMQQAAQLGMQGAQTGLQGVNSALQGYQQAGSAGVNAANIGNQQLTAQEGILNTQNQFGAQQQAQQQNVLSTAYNDFLNQKNYPYQQLSYMSNLIRGTPMGMNTTSQVYQAPPTTAQTVGSLGLGAAGIGQLMKAEGGSVSSYAGGGLGVIQKFNNPQAMLPDMSGMSKEELQAILQHPTTPAEAEAAKEELAILASESNGLASAYNQIPYSQQESIAAAGGGLMGYAYGGTTADSYLSKLNTLGEKDNSVTPEEQVKGIQALAPQVQSLYGPSQTSKFSDELAQEREKLEANSSQGTGVALLKAAQALSKGNNLVRGIGDAGAAFGDEVMKMQKEQRDAKNQLRQSQISLAAADQARADGQIGKAQELYKYGQDQKDKYLDRQISVTEKQAAIAEGIENSKRQAAASMSAANKPSDLDKQANALYNAAVAKNPEITQSEASKAQAMAEARAQAAGQLGRLTPDVRQQMQAEKEGAPGVDMALMRNKDYQKALKAGDYETAGRIKAQVTAALLPQSQGNQPRPAPQANQQPPAQPTIQAGTVMQGYRFKGGDPSNRANWEKV